VLVVWLLVYVIGYWAVDLGLRRSVAWSLFLGGSVALLLLVWPGPYPARMVGVPGDHLVNMHPPTLAVLALGCAQIGVLLLLRERVTPALQRPRVWAAVVWINLSIMTLYLWHEFVLVTLTRVLLPLGVPQPPAGAASWWLMRIAWVAVAGLGLVVVVVLLGRFERLPDAGDQRRATLSSGSAVAVVVLLFTGLLALAGTRVTEPLAVQHPIGLAVSPVVALMVVGVAWLVLAAERRRTGSGAPALVLGAVPLLALAVGYVHGWTVLPKSLGVAVTCVALAALMGTGAGVVAAHRRVELRAGSPTPREPTEPAGPVPRSSPPERRR
jgi:hypothetical protein